MARWPRFVHGWGHVTPFRKLLRWGAPAAFFGIGVALLVAGLPPGIAWTLIVVALAWAAHCARRLAVGARSRWRRREPRAARPARPAYAPRGRWTWRRTVRVGAGHDPRASRLVLGAKHARGGRPRARDLPPRRAGRSVRRRALAVLA